MPKGNQRTNREIRKPKAPKSKPGQLAASFTKAPLGSTMTSGTKKK